MRKARTTLYAIKDQFSSSDEYQQKYHGAKEGSIEHEQHVTIRDRLRYFHEAGLLVKKDLVDTDMLFAIVGRGLKQDYQYLKLIVESSRKVHSDPGIYEYFDYLYARYLQWEAAQQARRATQPSSEGQLPLRARTLEMTPS
ncbi:MAG TPA: hypothetical protein VLK82_25455 [Candidatus Tectomicrobia bacterium]|nr:hypothetical protein [Candidatus Tectomicrobia bacterium]